MDPMTFYSTFKSIVEIGNRLFPHQPGLLSLRPGLNWYKGWYVGHEPSMEDEYPALYTGEATILVDTLVGSGLPIGRWSNSGKRIIPTQAITVQGLPIFADEPDAEIVTENIERTWSLLGHSNRENEKWATTVNLSSPGSLPSGRIERPSASALLLPAGMFIALAALGHPLIGAFVAGGTLLLKARTGGSTGGGRSR